MLKHAIALGSAILIIWAIGILPAVIGYYVAKKFW